MTIDNEKELSVAREAIIQNESVFGTGETRPVESFGVREPVKYYCHAIADSAQAVTHSTEEIMEIDSYYGNYPWMGTQNSNAITIPANGLYHVMFNVLRAAAPTWWYRRASINVNWWEELNAETGEKYYNIVQYSTNVTSNVWSTVIDLKKGDYVQIAIKHTWGSDLSTLATYTGFKVISV